MKSYILLIACLPGLITSSFAQDAEEHHEAMGNYHDITGSELIIGHGFIPSAQMFTGSRHKLQYNNEQYSGAIFATYRYHLSKVVSLGAAFAYEYENGLYTDNYFSDYYFQNQKCGTEYYKTHGTFIRSSFTIAPEITFTYGHFAHNHIRLYSVIGLGYTFCNELLPDPVTDTKYISPYVKRTHANAYVSPFGVRAGGRLSGFFELGMGYKGVLSYGLTYRL